MKKLLCILFLLLLLTGCQTVQADPGHPTSAAPTTTRTATGTLPAETVAVTTEPAETIPPETEAPAPPIALADCVELVLPDALTLTPDSPTATVTVSFPRAELPADDRCCSLSLLLDGELLAHWSSFELSPALTRETTLRAAFTVRDPDRTALLEARLCWNGQTLVRGTTVRLDNDEPEVFYAKSGDSRPYSIDVLCNQNVVIVYGREDGGYTYPVKVWLCSTGNSTPYGTYWLGGKKEWGALFGGVWGQYISIIDGDILFHSVPYYRMAKDSLKTEEYNKLGTTASMGCVRLPVEGAKWIYDNCPRGTTVHIFDTNELPVERPEAQILDPEDPRSGWDPTDPDEENPWRAEQLTIDK